MIDKLLVPVLEVAGTAVVKVATAIGKAGVNTLPNMVLNT